ncbi:Bug family tripartite tricarboxylate transporter substrate binding protein [Pseudoroseomonas ludipueritiae]|uniref:Tripartite tricarboxylate transporter substrate binding protein n=1 Tax=Pseudoroseomonas ludipueritiae TaxID=198093 RepID=A0ABR7R4T4_9PROT|nr:tripartite tricarboxylate transporter substrate-binding protein [Pseudoroseomonas ludipueritiae]MBC9176640.1 tripartite tricarboxylate transporter substrate binding protein [Pseudoroseomonas ludipueritiae]
MMLKRRTLLATTLALPAVRARAASGWLPERPVRMFVPFAAGGPADIFGRVFADALGKELRQPVVVENRGGAGGLLGTDAVAKSAPDGSTLGFTGPGALSIAPAMPQQQMPFDVYKDLAHLTLVVRVPEVLVVNAKSDIKELAALVALAKQKPGSVNYGSAGVGSITHLASALLASEAKMEALHIPYRGVAPAATDLLSGRFTYLIADVPALRPHIEAGAFRPLAVTTAQRVPSLPDVPTTAELGLPRVISDNWYGLALPAATPAHIREGMRDAATRALNSPELAQGFAAQGGEASPLAPEAYLDFLQAEAAKWGPLVKQSGAESL